MIPEDQPTRQPLKFNEIIKNDIENEIPTIQKTTTFKTTKNTPSTSEKVKANEEKNRDEKIFSTDIVTLKDPETTMEGNNIMTQRIVEVVTTAVIINNRITTPVTLELCPSKGSVNLNVMKAYNIIFFCNEID